MLRFILCAFAAASLASPAMADTDGYISGIGEVHLFSDTQSPASQPPSNYVDGASMQRPAPAIGELRGTHIVLSDLYDQQNPGRLRPYAGISLGMLNINSGFSPSSNGSWTSAYSASAGVSVNFSQRLLGNFAYDMLGTNPARLMLAGTPAKVEYKRRMFILGVSYKLQ